TSDIKAWAESTGHQYLGTVEEDDVLMHYLRKASDVEVENEGNYDDVLELQKLYEKVDEQEDTTILDVREQAEYAFNHIPGALNSLLGELEDCIDEVDCVDMVYVSCRTGNRSSIRAQKLTRSGFRLIKKVVLRMSEWDGPTEKSI